MQMCADKYDGLLGPDRGPDRLNCLYPGHGCGLLHHVPTTDWSLPAESTRKDRSRESTPEQGSGSPFGSRLFNNSIDEDKSQEEL